MRSLRTPPPRAARQARARPPRARPRRARPSRGRVCSAVPGRGQRPRAERAGVPLAPGEQLEREADRRQRADRGHGAPQRARRARGNARGADGAEQERSDQVRAAALVLLGGRLGRDTALVAGDGLVLGAVVAHQLAAAQRDERRHDADQRRGELAAEAPAPLDDGRQRGAQRPSRRRRCRARTRSAGLGQSRRITGSVAIISDMRTTPRANGTRSAALEARARAARDLDAAVGCAHRRRPGRGAEQRQPVAQGEPAEAELLVAHVSHRSDPFDAVHEASAPPVRGRARRCARRGRGPC